MSENFLMANHCRNIKRLERMGFKFNGASPFRMAGTLTKRRETFHIRLFPLDGIAMVSDGSDCYSFDNCLTWNELLDTLVRRKAIIEKAAAKLKGGAK